MLNDNTIGLLKEVLTDGTKGFKEAIVSFESAERFPKGFKGAFISKRGKRYTFEITTKDGGKTWSKWWQESQMAKAKIDPDRLSRFVETDMSFITIIPPKSELAEDKNASNEGDAKLDQPT